MNGYMSYEFVKQRHADLIDEVGRSRPIRFRGYLGKWTGVTTSARPPFVAVARVLTNRTWTPTAD